MDLNIKFVSKFNHSFTNCDCLHYPILKALYSFKEKKSTQGRQARYIQFFPSKCSKGDFQDFPNVWKEHEIHQISLLNKLKNKQQSKNTALMIFLFLSLLLVIITVEFLELLNAVELQFLKSLRVICSTTACSSSMRPILDN